MCGIAGYCGPERRFSDERLQCMLRAIEHRGPDDSGIYTATAGVDRRIWIGSRRLAIQDLSPAGHQPMVDEGANLVAAFNGEIYNFLDLRARMEADGQAFRSRCDTEVALHSWRRNGPAAAEEWRGMFAAAFWDSARRELWLIRDPWGIKPLYYHLDGDGIAFCSEVRGLLAADAAPRRLSRRGIEDYLEFGAAQDPVTLIDGVYALLPGHVLRWSAGQVEIRRRPERPPEPLSAEMVEPMLREVVRQQLISDVPVVVFLSGGVDSSVIALLARQEAGPGVHTMTVIFDEADYSERQYARRVADHIGTVHHEVLLKAEQARRRAVDAIVRMDQPTIDGVNTFVVSEAAKQCGFTVALSGLGGDEFFGGYDTFRRAELLGKIRGWAQKAPALASLAGKALTGGAGRRARKLGRYLESGTFWEHPYFFQRRLFFPDAIAALCRGGEASAEADRLAESRRQSLIEEAETLDPLNQVSLLEARTYMANMLLRDSDQMSMSHSLELRVPFVDHVLAGRLLATPSEQKQFRRVSKAWLRQAFGRWLPEEVFARKKMGFTLPFEQWLKGPLCDDAVRTLVGNPGEIWRPEASRAVWEDFREGRVNWSRPWALYVLRRWAEKHVFC